MSEVEVVEKLAHALSERMRPSTPLAVDLWDIATVAQYLKRHTKVTRERIVLCYRTSRRRSGCRRRKAGPIHCTRRQR
jgi:hypothetical protein